MTINEIITRVDKLKPNAYDSDIKTAWLSELDGKIAIEVLKTNEAPAYTYPADGNTSLLVPAPYDSVYEHYLSAMIDYSQGEINMYNNSMLLYETKIDEYKKFVRRTVMPEQPYSIKF